VQCFGGYAAENGLVGGSTGTSAVGGICWDPVVGMYRATTTAAAAAVGAVGAAAGTPTSAAAAGQVYEQEQSGGNAA